MIFKMRLYFIAYKYAGMDTLEMIDGPYGTRSEAYAEMENLRAGREDPNLIVVRQSVEVMELERESV